MDIRNRADKLWDYVWNKAFCEKTNLVYDLRTSTAPDGNIADLPTPEEISRNYPNACGWKTGMEDSMINGGIMMDAVLKRYEKTGDPSMGAYARKLFEGMVLCSEISGAEGFLARSVSPFDGKSHYINSSRDQYTHVVHALCCYYDSPLCEDREKVRQLLVGYARRAERNITPENQYDYLRADGRQGIVANMWGDIGGHEFARLPMIYLAAWHVSGDPHWWDCYRAIRDEALEKTFVIEKKDGFFAIMQMQVSLDVLWRYDEEYREKYAAVMREAARRYEAYPVILADRAERENRHFDTLADPWRTLPVTEEWEIGGIMYAFLGRARFDRDEKFYLSDVADPIIVQGLCPGFRIKEETVDALLRIIDRMDIDNHGSDGPMHLLHAFWEAV